MKKVILYSFVIFIFGKLVASPDKPNFQDDIIPVFEQSCNSCHNPDKAKGGLDLTSMNGILAGGSSGEVALPGEPDNSLLYLLSARLQEPHMPPRGEKIEKSHLLLIKNWIAQGMLPTASGKPMKKKQSSINLALDSVSIGKPVGPPPMPKHLVLEPYLITDRTFAPSAMAVAPWSPLVALAGQKQVILYNTNNYKISGILPYQEGFIESLNFSRNGKLIVASGGRGGKSGNVVGWDVVSGKRVLDVGAEQDSILTADISADQSLVAIGGTSKLIKVFDLSTNEILYKVKKHSEWVTQVSFSPDGILLATADRNGGLYIWEAKTGNPFYSLVGHKEEITSLSWRADGNVLLSASEEGAVRTWEMINGKQVKTWNAHNGGTLSAHYAQNGNIVTAGRDKTVKFWDGNGKSIRSISGFSDIVMEARLSHDGSKIIAGDWSGKIGIWHSKDGKLIGNLNPNPPSIKKRIDLATEKVITAKKELVLAEEKLAPLTKKLDAQSITFNSLKSSFVKLVDDLNLAKKNEAQRKSLFESANNELTQKNNLKSAKQQLLELQKKELAGQKNILGNIISKLQIAEKTYSTHFNNLKVSEQKLAEAKIALDLNKSNPTLIQNVSEFKNSFDISKKALTAAKTEVSSHKAKIKQIENLIIIAKEKIIESENNFEKSKKETAHAQSEKIKKEQHWKESKQILSDILVKHEKALKSLSESEIHLKKTKEIIEGPLLSLNKAKSNLQSAEKNLIRWKAESVNTERHMELDKLALLNQESKEFKEVLENADLNKNSALQNLNDSKAILANLPKQISENKKLIDHKKQILVLAQKNQVSVVQLLEKKKSFLSEFESFASASKGFSENQESESLIQKANIKLNETMLLFKKDLAETQNELSEKANDVLLANQAVKEAENALQDKLTIQRNIPASIDEHNKKLIEATNNFNTAEKDYKLVLSKVEAQRKLSDSLLNKYTNLLN